MTHPTQAEQQSPVAPERRVNRQLIASLTSQGYRLCGSRGNSPIQQVWIEVNGRDRTAWPESLMVPYLQNRTNISLTEWAQIAAEEQRKAALGSVATGTQQSPRCY